MADRQVENSIFLLSEAYDSVIFPKRKALAKRNGQKLVSGKLPPYTAHYLHRYLPLNSQNPVNVFNSRNRRPTRHRILPTQN